VIFTIGSGEPCAVHFQIARDLKRPKRPQMDSCLYTRTQLISEITNHFLEFRLPQGASSMVGVHVGDRLFSARR
jgi:hypothetical protein